MSVWANTGGQPIRPQAGLLVLLALSGLLAAGCSEKKPAGPPAGRSAAAPETVIPTDATSAAPGGVAPSAAAAASPAVSQPPAPAAEE